MEEEEEEEEEEEGDEDDVIFDPFGVISSSFRCTITDTDACVQ